MFTIIYLGITWFLAGFLTGVTSFGGNLIAIPLITIVLSARDSIVVSCLDCIVVFIALVFIYRKAILWRETLWLGVCGLAGVPIGVWILGHASSRFLLMAAGISIGLFLLWQFFANRLHFSDEPISMLFCIPAGFLGGVMMSSIGMGGPPIILYSYLRKWGKENTISSANLAVGLMMFGIIPAQWQASMYSPQLLRFAAWGAVFAVLGTIASIPFERRMNIVFFRKLLLATLALSALMLIWRAIVA